MFSQLSSDTLSHVSMPRVPNHPPILPDKVNDIMFNYAVESSINIKPPTQFKLLIENFKHKSEREKTCEKLVQLCKNNPGDIRWIFWGLSHSDLNVRIWCNEVLGKIYICEECNGTGFCPHKKTARFIDPREYDESQQPHILYCLRCRNRRYINKEWNRGENAPLCPVCMGLGRYW